VERRYGDVSVGLCRAVLGDRRPVEQTARAVDYEDFEQALGDQLAHRAPVRLARLAKARSKIDKSDPRYAVALKRAFNL
jgi:hypothetical protein